MGFIGAIIVAIKARRSAAHDRSSRGVERDPVHCVLGLPMADAAERFPPMSTIQGYFYAWRASGLWQKINHFLIMAARNWRGEMPARQRVLLTAKASKPLRAAGFAATTRVRRSRGASVTSSPTP